MENNCINFHRQQSKYIYIYTSLLAPKWFYTLEKNITTMTISQIIAELFFKVAIMHTTIEPSIFIKIKRLDFEVFRALWPMIFLNFLQIT